MLRITASAALMVALCASSRAATPGGSDPDLRAAAVERQMTDAERQQLLHGIMALPMPGSAVPQGVKITAGYIRGVPRLGLPDILETDASLGVANPQQLRPGDVATAMPSGLALASSFDANLAFQAGAMIGSEARAKGFNVLLGGGANLARDPRNGRNFEYLGEDPLLAGTMAGEAVRGTQTQGVISTVKHFAVNDQETLRQTLDARIDEAALRESDLLAFEIAIERGQPGAVMCAYNKVNGEYACGNDFLLNRALKGDWGYRGWVMSDWGAVHDVSYFSKGLDQQSGEQLDPQVWFDAPLRAQIEAGQVPQSRVADAVRRILRSLYAVGADRPMVPTPIDYAAHAAVARQAAAEGIVLLRNDGLLPLMSAAKKIAVIGGHADVGVLSGGGSSQVIPYGGAPTLVPVGGRGLMAAAAAFSKQIYMPSSPLRALQAALPGSSIDYDSGYDVESAVAIAAAADIAIVFATQWQVEGADHASLNLPEGQDALIAAVARANPRVIVVLESGNPVMMPWLGGVRAVLEAWYPGQEGGAAIADALTGAINPAGRLPITFPVNATQSPRPIVEGLGLPEGNPITVHYPEGSDVGYRWFAAKHLQPAFPFGFGLSYTTFEFTQLKLRRADVISAGFAVRNLGQRAGAAVAQLYLVSAAGRTVQRLTAYSRVALEAGQSASVEVKIDPRLLASWDPAEQRWRIDAGRYVFALGNSAADLGERAAVTLPRRTLLP